MTWTASARRRPLRPSFRFRRRLEAHHRFGEQAGGEPRLRLAGTGRVPGELVDDSRLDAEPVHLLHDWGFGLQFRDPPERSWLSVLTDFLEGRKQFQPRLLRDQLLPQPLDVGWRQAAGDQVWRDSSPPLVEVVEDAKDPLWRATQFVAHRLNFVRRRGGQPFLVT